MSEKASKPRVDEDAGTLGAGGGGSNDVTSGAGNATGIPDAETADRAGNAVQRGNVEQDKAKLFPEGDARNRPGK